MLADSYVHGLEDDFEQNEIAELLKSMIWSIQLSLLYDHFHATALRHHQLESLLSSILRTNRCIPRLNRTSQRKKRRLPRS